MPELDIGTSATTTCVQQDDSPGTGGFGRIPDQVVSESSWWLFYTAVIPEEIDEGACMRL